MSQKVEAKFVFKNVFRTVDDWLKNKEKEMQKEKDVDNYMYNENDDQIFKNAYKNFDQYVNNVFQSDQSIKDYLRGRNQEQQKVYDSKFFKNVFSRSLEQTHTTKKNNNTRQSSPIAKQTLMPTVLRPLNLQKTGNNRSPEQNKNISATSYGSFRERGRYETDFFNKTSKFFQTTSKLQKESIPSSVKIHKFKSKESSIKSPSKVSQQGSLKINSFMLKDSKISKQGSMESSSLKVLPIIELEEDRLLEMNMPDEQTNINDYLKDTSTHLMKVENDIFNSHFISSKTLFKDSADFKDTLNNSTTFLLSNFKKSLKNSHQISPKRVQNKQIHQSLNVNIYGLFNVLKDEISKQLKFNLRLPVSCVQILNMLFEQSQDQLYKTLSQTVQKYIFCYDTDLIEVMSTHLKINFASKIYSYWELVTQASNLVKTAKKENEDEIFILTSNISNLEREINQLKKENEEYKTNLQTIQKKCETQFNSEKSILVEQLSQKNKDCAKLSDEIALYKKQLKTQEGIFLQNETEMKMITKQLELDFSTSIQQMEINMRDISSVNTFQQNKIFIMQDSYATQLIRERILDLESKISLIIEENSRLNARAGTNFFELTPRPSFSSIDQLINPNAPILTQEVLTKNTQIINFKQKSTQKRVSEKAKQIQQYVNNIKHYYENKIQELNNQQQLYDLASDQKKKLKQQTKHKNSKDSDKNIILSLNQPSQQISKQSIGADNEEYQQIKSGNDQEEQDKHNINQKKQILLEKHHNSQQNSNDFENLQIQY